MTDGIYELDTSTNITDNIIWQYDKAPKLIALINSEQQFFNNAVSSFFNNWYTNIFNLETANYFGLMVWAKILDCTNYIDFNFKKPNTTFGFGIYNKNFYRSNFATNVIGQIVPPELFRLLLKIKIFNMQSNGSLYDINRMLANIFPTQGAYATYDYATNTLTYHFTTKLPGQTLQLLSDNNVLLAPIGVARAIINGEE